MLWGAAAAVAGPRTQEDLVPAGVFEVQVGISNETQTQAIARDGRIHGLEVYTLPSPETQDAVSGSLSREIRETVLFLQCGITDRWNVSLLLPFVEARQHSTLQSKNPGANPLLDLYVGSLQSQTVSGMGNYRLTSLHRPVFTDFHAFVWGYGYWASLEQNTGVYTGIGSLETRQPYGGYYGLVHYTYFSRLPRSRFDARLEYQSSLTDNVNIPTGQRVSIQGGPTAITSLSWEHEPGAWGYGFAILQTTSQPTKLDGNSQQDPVKELLVRAQFSYGNLIDLEREPIRFPYQALLTWEKTIDGFDTPLRDRWGLVFRTYF